MIEGDSEKFGNSKFEETNHGSHRSSNEHASIPGEICNTIALERNESDDEDSVKELKNEVISLETFSARYPCYPMQTTFAYRVYNDLVLFNDLEDLVVMDGGNIDFEMYYFRGTIDRGCTWKYRYIFPFKSENEIDLLWLVIFMISIFLLNLP